MEELAERFGTDVYPDSPDGIRAAAALADASALIRAVAGITWADEHDELLDVPDIINQITLGVALRVFRNPDGYSQATAGDVSVSFAKAGSGGTGVYLTKEERRLVRQAANNRLTSVQLDAGYPNRLQTYLAPVQGSSKPIPLGPFPWEN